MSLMPEWIDFLRSLDDNSSQIRIHQLGISKSKKYELPLIAVSLGSTSPDAPVLMLTGGVHGLERIGSLVVLSLLQNFRELLIWDEISKKTLEKIRLVIFPFINPVGVMERTRSNPRGVDLMRNSPVKAKNGATFLVGGHQLTPRLPWFQGNELEIESQALIDLCRKEFFRSPHVISMDFHSGFGMQDQIWFPYAGSKDPFPHLSEAYSFKLNLDRNTPHHPYRYEPQSKHYTTHGDLWDHIYDLYRSENPNGVYLPLALEMGSWNWVRKNPLQIFQSGGIFNPIKPHRERRTLRRHQTLFDLLIRMTHSPTGWISRNTEQRLKNEELALELWYPNFRSKGLL